MRELIRRTDFIIIFMILIISVVLLIVFDVLGGDRNDKCVILHDDEIIYEVDLTKDGEFFIVGYENVIFEVKNHMVAFKKSDCPDKVCVNTGFISKSSKTAICLPNGLMIRFYGDNSVDEPDMISQ